jgi:hypothetical protein
VPGFVMRQDPARPASDSAIAVDAAVRPDICSPDVAAGQAGQRNEIAAQLVVGEQVLVFERRVLLGAPVGDGGGEPAMRVSTFPNPRGRYCGRPWTESS